MAFLVTLPGRPFLYSIFWCLAIVLATNLHFDLNKSPEESSVEELGQLVTHESYPGSSTSRTSDAGPAKRRCGQERLISSNTAKHACLSRDAQVTSSSNGFPHEESSAIRNPTTEDYRNTRDEILSRLLNGGKGHEQPNLHVHLDLINAVQLSHSIHPHNFIQPAKPANLPPHYSALGSGQVVEALIKGYYDTFCSRIDSEIFKAAHTAIQGRHKSLPFALANRLRHYEQGKVLRVLSAKSQYKSVQISLDMTSLYKILVISLYKKHLEILRELHIPLFEVRMMQINLLDWVEQQIFAPCDSLPIIGTIRDNHPNREEDGFPGPIRDTQKELIEYFAQDHRDPRPDGIVSNLLKTFAIQNRDKYVYLKELSKLYWEDPQEIVRGLEFDRKVALITTLADDFRIGTFRRQHISSAHKDYALFTTNFLQFEAGYPRTNFKRCEKRRYHPDLPLAMYYYVEVSNGYRILRILKFLPAASKSEQILQVDADALYQMFRRLARTVDHIHLKILNELEITAQETIQTKREVVLGALIEEILQPKFGFPIVGKIKVNADVPPWEDATYASSVVFGKVQLKFIKYFSEPPETEDVKGAAALFLASWYRDNHPTEFASFIEALEKP
ncbi:hypothetical protein PGTUg99_035339 [Puccinia graminis f. sp. tritici]|uniref:Uncharacterized protein n=1 Tax=Puccinia graminis f. sp. tritici TaxID=56615 RepID=A0A5B0SMC6_PUCGR|nr:hypothetical protein PGTUg99_035339 [Puccinia graminis f. sp. tritici]